MKRSSDFLSMLQPLYVAVASIIGIAIAGYMFIWSWKSPFIAESSGETVLGNTILQVTVPNFIAFVFVIAIWFAFSMVIFLPIWKQLFDLIGEITLGKDKFYKIGTITFLIVGLIVFIIILDLFLQISGPIRVAPDDIWPAGFYERIRVLIIFIAFTIMPMPLIILLIYSKVYEIGKGISSVKGNKKEWFKIAYNLLRYRSLLQNVLLIFGIVVSMIPIVGATFRSVSIALDSPNHRVEDMFPIIYVVIYGLLFTIILVVFYAPTHLILTQVCQQLRDVMCPIENLSDLDKNLKRRKDIDDWLQINISITQNLKAGVVTLAPLITSFVTTFIKI